MNERRQGQPGEGSIAYQIVNTEEMMKNGLIK